MINFNALYKISYGLYIVSSGDKNHGNGFVSNTVFQITSEPIKFAACCNKNNYTAELIQKYKAFSVSILEENTPSEIFGIFGYKSGRNFNKMQGMNVKYGESGVPIVLNSCIASLEFKLIETIDVGSHFMFIGELLNSELFDDTKNPITYIYYRNVKKGVAPKNAPTYIDKSKLEDVAKDTNLKRYQCMICKYIYDENNEKIKFKDLPDDWTCPVCGADKTNFHKI